MLTRALTAAVTIGLMAIGTGAVIAQSGGSSNGQSAAKSEYKPGYGPCKNDGTNPSGVHTGPPGQPGQNCDTKPGKKPRNEAASGSCVTGSSFTVRLPRSVRSATVRINGKKVKTRRRNGRLTARYPMANATKGPKVIRVSGTSKSGRKVAGQRVFNPCRSAANPTVRTKSKKS